MIPWPIALLAAFYTALATASAASAWKALNGVGHDSPVVAAVWSAISAVSVVGLVLLKPWARRLTVYAAMTTMVIGLALAAYYVLQGQAAPALWATGFASLQTFVMRYLTRPRVKAWFEDTPAQHG